MFENKYPPSAYPSKRYFESVETREDYDKFIASGMAYEFEVNCPNSWEEHLKMIKELENK